MSDVMLASIGRIGGAMSTTEAPFVAHGLEGGVLATGVSVGSTAAATVALATAVAASAGSELLGAAATAEADE